MTIRCYTVRSTAGTIANLQRGKHLAMILLWTHIFSVKNCVAGVIRFRSQAEHASTAARLLLDDSGDSVVSALYYQRLKNRLNCLSTPVTK